MRSDQKRFQSGEQCVHSGRYEFDGYAGGPPEPLPQLKDWEIRVVAGQVFPKTQHPNRSCYWTPVRAGIPPLSSVGSMTGGWASWGISR